MAIVVYWTLTCYNISSNSCDISNLFARKPSEHLNYFNKNFCFPYWLLVDKNAICYEYPFIHGQSYNNLTFKTVSKMFCMRNYLTNYFVEVFFHSRKRHCGSNLYRWSFDACQRIIQFNTRYHIELWNLKA